MKRLSRWISIVLTIVTTTVMILSFQNCAKSFQATGNAGASSLNLSSVSSGAGTRIVFDSGNFKANEDMHFSVYSDQASSSSATVVWTHDLDNMIGACESKVGSRPDQVILNCPQAGRLHIQVSVKDGSIPRAVDAFPMADLVDDHPTVAEQLNPTYTIPAGTGTGPWNSRDKVVETFIGQTLTVKNGDTSTHRMHTNGNPCSHGADFPAGGSANCVIAGQLALKAAGVSPASDVYDHNVGTGAAFYLTAYSGSALYTQKCVSCHESSMTSVTGKAVFPTKASVALIRSRLSTVPAMTSAVALQGLTKGQLQAISNFLGGFGH